jgi:hypothetical protein
MTKAASSDRDYDSEITTWDDYFVVRSGGCRTISFYHEFRTTADWQYNPDTGSDEPAVTQKFYPSRIVGRPLLEGCPHLPPGVRTIYVEAHAALCNRLPVFAGIGIRAILEAVCKEKTNSNDKLWQQIDQLAQMGHIPAEGAEILHGLRFLGNDAAHEAKAHTEQELDAAFDVIEHLLRGVYVIPGRAAYLPRKDP